MVVGTMGSRLRLPDEVVDRLGDRGLTAITARSGPHTVEARVWSGVELRQSQAEGGVRVVGYASTYDQPYPIYGGPEAGGFMETIAPGAFDKSLSEKDDVRFLSRIRDLLMPGGGLGIVVPAMQGRTVEVTRNKRVRYREARFMPDGKTVLAVSDESGEFELWTAPANGIGASTQLTSTSLAHEPACRAIAARAASTPSAQDPSKAAAMRASLACAWASVTSLSMSKNALCGLPPVRAKKAVATSTALTCLVWRAWASWATLMSCKVVIFGLTRSL